MKYQKEGAQLKIILNEDSYRERVVYKCFYWYTGRYNVTITKEESSFIIALNIPADEQSEEKITGIIKKINQDLIDFRLRDIVTNETKEIRELIIAKAFAHFDTDEDPETEVSDPVGFHPETIT